MKKIKGINILLLLLAMLAGFCAFSCSTTKSRAQEPAVKPKAEPQEVTFKEVTRNGPNKHNGYTYELWNQNSLGNALMTLRAGCTFDFQWSGTYNTLARIGLRPGFDATVVAYNVENYSVKRGLSYLCIYGWTYNKETRDNLVEFYIVDNWINFRPPGGGGTLMGTVTVDGDEYDIYTSLRTEQPSILGTRTFYQYWSVRKNGQQRTSGTIDVQAHFNAWKELGMEFGDTLHEVSFCIEGFDSSQNGEGNAEITELSFTSK
ncbi:MAG: glycoside hydrolase family 11 protein [Spirochaetales bacterium]|nr:glycoside hydrolase family 11 protein [Spirochaetales bacterium]